MALCGPQLQKLLLNKICCNYGCNKISKKNIIVKGGEGTILCSAIAIDAPASTASVSGIRWGSAKLKGAREEMEDDVVLVQSDRLDGFSYAAVFDGHAGFSAVQFLREKLYEECVGALEGGKLLSGKDFKAVEKALQEAFERADAKLLKWLEENGEDESGSTATAIFVRDDVLFVSHVGDSCVLLSRSGKAQVLTDSHRPYGSNKASLDEIRRILGAGGWIVNGRICGDISVSRAFGDIRFKTKKNEMVKKGVREGRWTEKFASRWDVVNFIRNELRQHGNVQMASEGLAQMALNQGSADNISIIVADLGRTDWKNLAVQKENVVFEVGQAVATISFVSFGIWTLSTLLP
ncbi:hypothetical protein ACS0TY_010445 [Phlomoides rotata]